jgi:hypothetical protein
MDKTNHMDIDQVTTAHKVGEFNFNIGRSARLLSIDWIKGQDITSDDGRVYLLCVNGVIKKIGGSQSKGGIKATMSFYISANQGRPSIRSFGIMSLIANELKKGNDVSLYLITSPQVIAPVNGLFGKTECKVSAFKEMERQCLQDYKTLTGGYPDWNFQESGLAWSKEIQSQHADMLK